MIETYLLEQLDAAARCGTLLAASEKLHITQPSMSRAMKKLEDLIGVELFEHRGNRLVLNDYGRIAVDYARRILDSRWQIKAVLTRKNIGYSCLPQMGDVAVADVLL